MHCGYVVKVENLRPHGNADRLQIATFFGNDTCVGLDVVIGEIGIYFPTDLQLSVEYCNANNLVRKKDESGNNIGGYMDPDKRNVTAVRLRGERSDLVAKSLALAVNQTETALARRKCLWHLYSQNTQILNSWHIILEYSVLATRLK